MNRSWTPAIVWIRSDEGDLFYFQKKNFFDHPLSLLKIVLLGRLWPVNTAVSPHSWPLGTFCISFPPRKTSQWQRARGNSCFCRLSLHLPFGLAIKQMHVNFTVPEQLCRPTITSPLLLRLTSYWQVLLTSQTTTRLMGCSGTIGHQQIFNPWKGWLQEGT